jgi:hypothetical protein
MRRVDLSTYQIGYIASRQIENGETMDHSRDDEVLPRRVTINFENSAHRSVSSYRTVHTGYRPISYCRWLVGVDNTLLYLSTVLSLDNPLIVDISSIHRINLSMFRVFKPLIIV